MVVGRESEQTLFDESAATFEDDAGAYNQADAAGFIKLECPADADSGAEGAEVGLRSA